ncbi:thioredoxin domain-containing protein [Lentibacillus sp. CBA3610]|uniref:thioredoxin domain-containing protein n=1 Tax=Lentibacillus sp. CBA3610 TaxID=2518176 RepID=UPI001595DDE8|nr:thioredoxin domain-containing protein [Lentibacillus sp. CBA3610]QKY70000.1 thioredoxin domain-containing protein [Lentibacillus sp. CBA3610]
MSKEHRHANRLVNEKSPYLLQHAYNPVDWFPWGDEAFEKAKQEDKPIFLSVGYSTCHWCHVLAHESFEDEEVASYLNDHYIAIKVDREERPDIDSVYMKVCQMMTGQGGWPLSIFMTPDKVPFYAGTYFPRNSKYGMPGFMDVITQLYEKYKQDPDRIAEVTKSVTDALAKTVSAKSDHRLTKDITDKAFEQLEKRFDSTYGGFGSAPKFPTPQNLLYLVRYYHFTGNTAALEMAESTLQAMARGGIYDHVGFGFARYSTDEKWLVPHFEKMLYDNALLLMAYTECYQITGNPHYKEISEQIITFVMREMFSSEGGFYSAIDADSEGVEGKYYVWDYDEIFNILGEEYGDLYTSVYGMTLEGNFEGKNIPNLLSTDMEEIAEDHGLTLTELHQKLDVARKQLLSAREERVHPHVDDKILTSWNAMMIAALAKAGKVFEKPEYTRTAETSIHFIEQHLIQDNRVMARYRDGEVKYNGYLDDYAFLLWAYEELYEATFSLPYLKQARYLTEEMIDLFWDNEQGGFFFNGYDSEELLSREKEVYDGALPSGNGVAAVMLGKIGYLTGETAYLDKLDGMYYSFYDDIGQVPVAGIHFIQSLLLMENPTKEVVILGAAGSFTSELQQLFLPDVTLLASNDSEQLAEIAPFTSEYKQLDGEVTIYVCENFACHQPTTDTAKAWEYIRNRR